MNEETEKLEKEITDIIEHSDPSCGIDKECWTECGKCGAERALKACREAGLKFVIHKTGVPSVWPDIKEIEL